MIAVWIALRYVCRMLLFPSLASNCISYFAWPPWPNVSESSCSASLKRSMFSVRVLANALRPCRQEDYRLLPGSVTAYTKPHSSYIGGNVCISMQKYTYLACTSLYGFSKYGLMTCTHSKTSSPLAGCASRCLSGWSGRWSGLRLSTTLSST